MFRRHKLIKFYHSQSKLIRFFAQNIFFHSPFIVHHSPLRSEAHPRFAGVKTVSTQNRASDFRLERNVVVLAAVVADDLVFGRRVFRRRRFFRAAARTPLRRHHIALVKNSLLFFREKENILALHTRHFNVRHRVFSS